METKQQDTKDRELFLSRTLNAPVELVWEVCTKPEHLAKWWGPNGFTNTIIEMNVTPGGNFDLTMHGPDGTDYPNHSVYKEIVPFKKIVHQHISYPHMLTTIEFEAQGEKTHLKWHMLFESAEVLIDVVKKHGAKEGLEQNVERMAVYVQEM